MGKIDLNEVKPGFENVTELQDANEDVKKIFSLEFATNWQLVTKLKTAVLEKVKEHPLDSDSLEVRIALYTIIIRNQIRHCFRFRNDKLTKRRLIKMMAIRRCLLDLLKSMDIEKYTWLTSELQLKHKERGKFDDFKLSRKGLRKKVARDAAIALKKEKMEIFRTKLEQERIVFEKEKEEEMARIEEELKALGIGETMTSLKETLEALDLGDLAPRVEPWVSRRRLLLQKKFVLYGAKKKIRDDEILKAYGFLTESEMPYLP